MWPLEDGALSGAGREAAVSNTTNSRPEVGMETRNQRCEEMD
jgi:hypothetical protein